MNVGATRVLFRVMVFTLRALALPSGTVHSKSGRAKSSLVGQYCYCTVVVLENLCSRKRLNFTFPGTLSPLRGEGELRKRTTFLSQR